MSTTAPLRRPNIPVGAAVPRVGARAIRREHATAHASLTGSLTCFGSIFQAVSGGGQGAPTEFWLENAINLECRSREFHFAELGRHVGAFVSQHPDVEVVRLQSARSDLPRQRAGHGRVLCLLAEANGRARVEQHSQLDGLPGGDRRSREAAATGAQGGLGAAGGMGEVRH